jgi:nicotinate dehydrogenase subunit A
MPGFLPDFRHRPRRAAGGRIGRMATYTFRLNGRLVTADSWDPAQPLLYVLRDQFNLHGAKFGCGLGQCGACTVLVDGTAARACRTPVSRAASRSVTTIEGLGTVEQPHRVQTAFIAEQAAQCGYCTSGMIMTAAAFLSRTPAPTAEQTKTALAGNLCRCGTHTRILRAVLRAARA